MVIQFFILVVVIVLGFIVIFFVGESQQQAEIEKQKETYRMIVEEAWHKGNVDILDEYYAPDYVYHRTYFPEIRGLEAYKQNIVDTRAEMPDLIITIKDIIVEDDRIVSWGILQGTQVGIDPVLGISTGLKLEIDWLAIIHKENGKYVDAWMYSDNLGLFEQLGYKMLPPLTENTFARVTLTQMDIDKMEDAVKLYQESVVPDAQSQKGYRGVYLLSNFKTGKNISIAIWDSEEDAIANEQSGYYQKQVDRFKDIFTAPPVREGYTVTVQE